MKNICGFELQSTCVKIDCDSQHLRDTANLTAEQVLQDLRKYFGYCVPSGDHYPSDDNSDVQEGRALTDMEHEGSDSLTLAKAKLERIIEESGNTLPLSKLSSSEIKERPLHPAQ